MAGTQLQLRRGTTAQHATFTGAVGEVTVDTDKDILVLHDGALAGGYPQTKGATGAGGDEVVVENGDTVTTNYTLSTGKNGMSVGPMTVNSGIALTVPSGKRWVVL